MTVTLYFYNAGLGSCKLNDVRAFYPYSLEDNEYIIVYADGTEHNYQFVSSFEVQEVI